MIKWNKGIIRSLGLMILLWVFILVGAYFLPDIVIGTNLYIARVGVLFLSSIVFLMALLSIITIFRKIQERFRV